MMLNVQYVSVTVDKLLSNITTHWSELQ